MRLFVNGRPQDLSVTIVSEALEQLSFTDERGLAVAVDGVVIPRAEWSSTQLHDGQRVEVLRAVQGG